MPDWNDYRSLLRQARRISRLSVDSHDAQDAVAQVRRKLMLQQAGQSHRLRRILIMSGSIAAGIVVVLSILVSQTPRRVDAAESLQESAQVTQQYRGWVHVVPTAGTAGSLGMKPALKAIHINTADHTIAIIFEILGQMGVQMAVPAQHKQFMYVGMLNELHIGPMDKGVPASATRSSAEFPLKLADMLADMKAAGVKQVDIAGSVDQGMQRFELTFKAEAKELPEQYRQLAGGKQTIWADPKTKLICKVQTLCDGEPMLLEYTYGAPEIHDIYDVGVPRNAQVFEEGDATSAEREIPVFKIPDVSQLTKDASVDVEALRARVKQRMDASFGDYVMLECQQQKQLRGGHLEGRLSLQAQEGEKFLSTGYLVAPAMAFFGGPGFPTGWPEPKLNDALAVIKPATPVSLVVINAQGLWRGSIEGQGLKLQPATRPVQPFPRYGMTLGEQFWPGEITPGHIYQRMMPKKGGGSTLGVPVVRFEAFRDPRRPGLVVLHKQVSSPDQLDDPRQNVLEDTMHWLDPAHDDLPVETLSHTRGLSFSGSTTKPSMILDSEMTTRHIVILDFGKLPNGRWYPAHGQDRWIRPATPGITDNGAYVERWRQLLPDAKLAAEWYEDPGKRLHQGAGMFSRNVPSKTPIPPASAPTAGPPERQ